MMRYLVTFTQYNEYYVEADDENEAEKKGYEAFYSEMTRPVAHTYYDECEVECLDDEEEE